MEVSIDSGKRQFWLAFDPIKVAILLLVVGLLTGGISVPYALCVLIVLGFSLNNEEEAQQQLGLPVS